MSVTVFLQKFVSESEETIPLAQVVEFVSEFGVIGKLPSGLEVTFPPDKIAAVCTIQGNEEAGVTCIALERPIFGDSFRAFAFGAMQRFDLFFLEDNLGTIYTIDGAESDLPKAIRAECENGVVRIASYAEIWPQN